MDTIAIRAALDEYEAIRNHVGGCSDGGCIVLRPVGMHTNGGCRCARDQMKAQRMMRAGQSLHEKIAAALLTTSCGACNGTGWVIRDPDIGTDQECGVCNQ